MLIGAVLEESTGGCGDLGHLFSLPFAAVQPWWIQGIRRVDRVSEERFIYLEI